MQVFMELFSRSTTPSQSHTLEGSTGGGAGGETGSKMQKGRKGWASILGLCGHSPFTLRWLETHLERTQSVAVRIILLVLFFLDVSGRNFGQVVFCNNPITGLIVFIGMLISSPILGLAGILSSTISIIFALATNHPREGLTCGGAGFNAILFGVVMKAIVLNSEEKIEDVEAVTWITICVGAAFTVILTNGLGSLLGSASPPVPCLSLPFNLTAVVATLTLTFINELPGHEGHQGDRNLNESAALLNHTSVDIESYDDIDYSLLLQGSLLGMGQVAAINDITCSALIIVGMLIFSPLLTLTAFLGSLFSTFVAAHLSSSLLEFAYNGLMGYNGVLTACAVMFFLVPCTTSILINLVAVLATLLVQIAFGWAFNDISLPYFSLPFVVVCLSVLGVRGPPRPAVLTFPEHHIAQWKESAVTLSAPMASLSLVSLSQQSAHSSTLTDSRWRRTPSL
ncbi:urea transporter 2-like [Neocloeon triangulifer]|uniref:urea transporter 2-like n=1 Tax=Neocloeon triangulifer TaxID=2078957 RepID=UPI00286F1260|nr:urea transporter 2-like [Neocloeon triangulifer]XP_059468736.1 urea transporter 2-like [Neocloeon triangulifer]XP_059468737.1 urea transporter 2-like [Neocloeon triangulifer]